MTHAETTRAFTAADHAWSRELRSLFGKEAGDVRYTKIGRGAEGSELRRLHDARDAARVAWEETGKSTWTP